MYMFFSNENTEIIITALREHLRAHKAVLYLSHSFLYFIDFIHEFHMHIINFVYKKV